MELMDVQRTLIVYANEIDSFNTRIHAGYLGGFRWKKKIKTSKQCNKQKLIHTFQPNKSTNQKHYAK